MVRNEWIGSKYQQAKHLEERKKSMRRTKHLRHKKKRTNFDVLQEVHLRSAYIMLTFWYSLTVIPFFSSLASQQHFLILPNNKVLPLLLVWPFISRHKCTHLYVVLLAHKFLFIHSMKCFPLWSFCHMQYAICICESFRYSTYLYTLYNSYHTPNSHPLPSLSHQPMPQYFVHFYAFQALFSSRFIFNSFRISICMMLEQSSLLLMIFRLVFFFWSRQKVSFLLKVREWD